MCVGWWSSSSSSWGCLPLLKALAKHMDAIVVDTKATMLEIAQFLSANRAMLRENLLPLDYLDPPQIKERLRELGPTRKLVADVMTFDPKFKPVRAAADGCAAAVHRTHTVLRPPPSPTTGAHRLCFRVLL
jgi:hypothetical protein